MTRPKCARCGDTGAILVDGAVTDRYCSCSAAQLLRVCIDSDPHLRKVRDRLEQLLAEQARQVITLQDVFKKPYPRTSAKLVAARAQRLADLGPRPPWWRFLARRRYDRARSAVLAMDVSEERELLMQLHPAADVTELAARRHLDLITKAPREPGALYVRAVEHLATPSNGRKS